MSYGMMHGSGSMGGGIPMMIGGIVMMVLFLAVIVALAVWIVRALGEQSGGRGGRSPRPVEVLEERYARGEIDDEEFRKRRDALERS